MWAAHVIMAYLLFILSVWLYLTCQRQNKNQKTKSNFAPHLVSLKSFFIHFEKDKFSDNILKLNFTLREKFWRSIVFFTVNLFIVYIWVSLIEIICILNIFKVRETYKRMTK